MERRTEFMTAVADTNTLPKGSKVGDHTIESVISIKSQTVTYLAVNYKREKVVLKEFNPAGWVTRDASGTLKPVNDEAAGHFEMLMFRFRDVGEKLSAIRCASIVTVLQVISANGTAYLAMPMEDGFSLKDVLKQSPVLEYGDLKTIAFPLLDALKVLHKNQMLHLAISTENILIRKNGAPVLIGFGTCMGGGMNGAKLPSNAEYAPIEQFSADKNHIGPWTDIYSFAAVLYQCMSGRLPVRPPDRLRALQVKSADPYEKIAGVCKGPFAVRMLEAVDHALALAPTERPQKVADWTQEFLALTVEGDITVRKEIPASAPAKPADEFESEDRYTLFRSFLGGERQSYYLAAFINQHDRGFIPRAHWNWGACVLGLLWLAYRRMYAFFGLGLIASVPVALAIHAIANDRALTESYWLLSPAIDLTVVVYVVIVALFLGFWGNYIYYLHARYKIHSARRKFTDVNSQRKYLSRTGGTKAGASIVASIILAIALYYGYGHLLNQTLGARQQIDEALNVLEYLKQKTMEFKTTQGRWPQTANELFGERLAPSGKYIGTVSVLRQLLVVTFRADVAGVGVAAELSGKSIALYGSESNGMVHWTCASIDAPIDLLPRECRTKLK